MKRKNWNVSWLLVRSQLTRRTGPPGLMIPFAKFEDEHFRQYLCQQQSKKLNIWSFSIKIVN